MDACASAQSNLTTCNAKSIKEKQLKNNQTFKNHLHFTTRKLRLLIDHECFKYHEEKTTAH